MMKLIFVLFLVLVSCKNRISQEQVSDLDHKQSPITEIDTIYNANISKSPVDKSKIKSDTVSFDKLFNRELIGLSIKNNKKSKTGEKKYWIDIYSNCVCDAPSLLIAKEQKEMYLYNYCSNSIPPNSKEPFYKYFIEEILLIEKLVRVKVSNQDNEVIVFSFKKLNEDIYELDFEGDIPSEYIGARVNKFFTPSPENFEEEDCDDFEG